MCTLRDSSSITSDVHFIFADDDGHDAKRNGNTVPHAVPFSLLLLSERRKRFIRPARTAKVGVVVEEMGIYIHIRVSMAPEHLYYTAHTSKSRERERERGALRKLPQADDARLLYSPICWRRGSTAKTTLSRSPPLLLFFLFCS